MRKKFAVGTDIGGSHISCGLVDMETGRLLEESCSEQNVDNQASAEEILSVWATALQQTMDHCTKDELAGIGFAMPGPFDYKNGVALLKNVAKYDSLYGIHVGAELKIRLNLPDEMPLRYLNDALSFAVGECWAGEASHYKNVIAITLGTGFGSAFLTHGVPVIEGDRVPKMGYVYHIPYQEGIADDYFSTRWFVKEYAERTGTVCKGVKEIALLAESKPEAKTLFESFGKELGSFLAPLAQRFEAESIIVGGNIAGAFPLFGPAFQLSLNKSGSSAEIILSKLKETAAMVGSSRLLDKEFWLMVEPLVAKI